MVVLSNVTYTCTKPNQCLLIDWTEHSPCHGLTSSVPQDQPTQAEESQEMGL